VNSIEHEGSQIISLAVISVISRTLQRDLRGKQGIISDFNGKKFVFVFY